MKNDFFKIPNTDMRLYNLGCNDIYIRFSCGHSEENYVIPALNICRLDVEETPLPPQCTQISMTKRTLSSVTKKAISKFIASKNKELSGSGIIPFYVTSSPVAATLYGNPLYCLEPLENVSFYGLNLICHH